MSVKVKRKRIFIHSSLLLVSLLCGIGSQAQQDTLHLNDILKKVETSLPALEASRHQVAATEQDIAWERRTMIPEVTAGYQINMATYNKITGMTYPGFLLPISGPPSATNKRDFVPGSAVGAVATWTPVTFGQRQAAIEKATAIFRQAGAAHREKLFRFQYQALHLYVEALYFQQVLNSLEAALRRHKVSLQQALVLANSGLRPGIDTTQFQSQIAQAEIDFLKTETTLKQTLVELSTLTGSRTGTAPILADILPGVTTAPILTDTGDYSLHPLYQTMESQRQVTLAGLKELNRSWLPKLDFWGTLYARGSGIAANGTVDKTEGFGFSRTNAGAGIQLMFPVLKFYSIGLRRKQYRFLVSAGEARLAESKLEISRELENAKIAYDQQVKIAARSPQLLKAATDIYNGLTVSYSLGLIDFTRLSVAQYDLQKAEINSATSRLDLWRTLLGVAVAKGNLQLFTEQLDKQ